MNGHYAIFHIDDERALKGGERQLLYLAFQLRTLGHWNCIVCRSGSGLDAAARAAGFDRLHLPFLLEWDPVSAFLLRSQVQKTARAADGAKPEHIVLHSHTAHAAGIAFLAARGLNCRRIVHRREDFPLSNTLSINAKYSTAQKVIAVSDAVRAILHSSGVPPEKTAVVRDCVPLTGFPWDGKGLAEFRKTARARLFADLSIPEDSFCIGAVTALESHKDPLSFIRSMPEVLLEVPWTHFVLSGSGPLQDEVKRLAMDLKIAHRLHLIGSHADPLALVGAFDMLTVSTWGEGMGGLVLEAMAAGTPVVASRAGGLPEIIEDGVNGVLVNPRSPLELAKSQVKLLKDAALRARLAAAGFERRKVFSSENAAARVLEIYAGN